MGRAKGSQTATTGAGLRTDKGALSATIKFVMFPKRGAPDKGDGFTIAKAIHEGTGKEIILKGKFGPVQAGEVINIARSEVRADPRYGDFIQVWQRSYEDPVTRDALLHYLEQLPGVGPSMAIAIADTYGADALAKIDADPSLLLQVRSNNGHRLQPADLQDIMDKWEDLRADRKNLLFLSTLGVGDATAKKVSAHFGANTLATIKNDPYAMTQVDGVGFRIADTVAAKQGIATDDPRRLAAGMEYLLEGAERDGHICLSREEMLARAPKLLARGNARLSDAQLSGAIDSMIADGRLWQEDGPDGKTRVYTTELYVVESRLYDQLETRLAGIDDPDAIPSYLQAPKDSILTDEQYQAIWRSREYPLSILSGGAGSGKTTTLNEMLEELEGRGETYLCMAPTGKAAKRMSEATSREASTIHRRLGWEGRNAPRAMTGAQCDENSMIDEDVVIIDEASMLDMRLAERLFSHLSDHTRVVLVGDPNQLPAVGAGSVLLDLIESGRVPRTHLDRIHRQGADSLLVENANRIRQGQEPFWTKQEAESATGKQFQDDFEFVETTKPKEAADLVVATAARVATELGVPENDVLVATAQRTGEVGTYILNQRLQDRRNPSGTPFRDGNQPLRTGDRVMNVQNRYGKRNQKTGDMDPDIMNGDVGKVTGWDPTRKIATVEFEDGDLTYQGSEMDALIPAYGCTTHKLQGSEGPAVLAPYVVDSRMNNRNHLYTSLTRGRKKGILIGSKDVIRAAVARDGTRRNTTLDLRVGAIPKLLQQRYEKVAAQPDLQSAQQLLGGFAIARVGHVDLTPSGQAAAAADPANTNIS